MSTFFNGFYQFGFVAHDLDEAIAALADRFGVRRFRRKQSSDWMWSAHAWAGDTMIEVISVSDAAPTLYRGYVPDDPSAVRLHHHGFKVSDLSAWRDLEVCIEKMQLDKPLHGEFMGGDLKVMYVDTRTQLGIYCEFVHLSGAATKIYDDVPRN